MRYVKTIVQNINSDHFSKVDNISKRMENHFDFHTFRKASEMEVKYGKSLNNVSDKLDRLDITAKQYQDLYNLSIRR